MLKKSVLRLLDKLWELLIKFFQEFLVSARSFCVLHYEIHPASFASVVIPRLEKLSIALVAKYVHLFEF